MRESWRTPRSFSFVLSLSLSPSVHLPFRFLFVYSSALRFLNRLALLPDLFFDGARKLANNLRGRCLYMAVYSLSKFGPVLFFFVWLVMEARRISHSWNDEEEVSAAAPLLEVGTWMGASWEGMKLLSWIYIYKEPLVFSSLLCLATFFLRCFCFLFCLPCRPPRFLECRNFWTSFPSEEFLRGRRRNCNSVKVH